MAEDIRWEYTCGIFYDVTSALFWLNDKAIAGWKLKAILPWDNGQQIMIWLERVKKEAP